MSPLVEELAERAQDMAPRNNFHVSDDQEPTEVPEDVFEHMHLCEAEALPKDFTEAPHGPHAPTAAEIARCNEIGVEAFAREQDAKARAAKPGLVYDHNTGTYRAPRPEWRWVEKCGACGGKHTCLKHDRGPVGCVEVPSSIKHGKFNVHLHDPFPVGMDPPPIPEKFQREAAGPLPFVTGAQLSAMDCTVDYLIPGVLAADQPGMIGGSFKTLKTSVAVDLTLSLATRGRFLGMFPVARKVRTLLLSGESGDAVIKETASRIALSKGKLLKEFEEALFGFELPVLGDETSMARLLDTVRDAACKAEVVIVDPLYLSLPADVEAGNVFKMGPLLRSVGQAVREAGAMPILVHHLKRHTGRDEFTPPELSDLAWAGCAEFARQWILLARREKFDPDQPHHKLWLSVGGSAGHCGLWGLDVDERPERHEGPRQWVVDIKRASEARGELIEQEQAEKDQQREAKHSAKFEADKAKVLKFLKTRPDGETKTGIRERVNVPGARLGVVIDDLLDSGEAEVCQIGKRNKKGTRNVSGIRLAKVNPDNPDSTRVQPGLIGLTDNPDRFPPIGESSVLSENARSEVTP